jgi:hypothetical protein
VSRQAITLVYAVLALALAAGAASGCGTKTEAKQWSGATVAAAATTTEGSASPRSNQRRLTRAQSLRLVAWATSFRTCMIAADVGLGPLLTDETQIAMKLPASVEVADLLQRMETCAERQGGPPHRASLQYRPGEVVLYLPKQCLLDEKVAGS